MKDHKEKFNSHLKDIATMMAVNCVRNTVIEKYHAGKFPISKTRDYSDATVVTPDGDIPWNEVSRISDTEMKAFNIEVVNRIYTFLQYYLHPDNQDKIEDFLEAMNEYYPQNWNQPEFDENMLKWIEGFIRRKEIGDKAYYENEY